MDKKTIIYSFKTIFKKTKLICPYCGTVQNYKKNSCCVCHKSLDSVKDNTLKIKNCIRAGIGILVLSVISVVTAMVINNALKKKPVNDNKYVQKETDTTSKTEETSLTKETTENTTSVKETTSETPTTQAPTTESTTTVPPTEKTTVPESKPFSIDDVKWIKEPYLSCDTVIPLSEVVGENSDMRFSDGGDWWSRAYYGFIEGNNTDLKKYQPHKYGLVDFNGNVVIDYSYEIEVSEPHGHAYIGHGDDSGSVIDINGNKTGAWAGGIGERPHLYYNTYDGKFWSWSEVLYIFDSVSKYDGEDNICILSNIYYDGDYKNTGGWYEVNGNVSYLDTYTIYNLSTGRIVDTVDDYYVAGKIGNSECISVKKNGKYIFIDENGKQIVPGTYDFARCFRDGLAAVYKDGKAGYIDTTLTVSLGRDPDVDYSFDEDVMPDIVGISLDEAKKLCEKQGIILIVSEYQYNADYDAMYVLAQGVKEGEAIQKDATVEIVLSKGKQSYIVPDVVYFEEEEAINIVKERGLDCDITYKEDENVAEGCVVSQSVAAGTQAKAGDVISLVVSSGPPKFDMIDVVGEQHKDAEEKLHELGLVVTVDYIYDENYELGTVIKQSEEKGAKVYKGYEITITVVSDEALINVPDVVGKDFDEATEMITSANLKVEKNEIYDNNVAAGLVISQTPQAGSSQKGGTKILLTVSLGKQPVTVKFNSLGGTCPESERTVYYTETYGELPVPTMQYHKFLGWYTAEKSGSQVEADTKVNNVNSQTLYARWERIYVRVAFDANGGKVGTSSTNIAMGEKYSLPTPERKYYSFDGWYTEKNGGTKVTSSDVMSTGERHTLYAHWTVKSVTVTYDAGSGNVTGDTNVKYNLGTEYGKKLATRTGYTFMGWYTKANGSGTKVLETDIVTDEKEHTLYAYWSNKAITITLDPRSGTLSERSIKAEYDKEYGTLPTPERKGYTFEGWYTSASGGDRVTEFSVCKDEKDATLYARWANQQFNVYFNSNGGSCSTNNKTVTYNNSYGDLPSATRTGYTFAGWYTECSGGRNVNQNTTYTDINDTTLYAHWNKNSYTVTFDANGGSCSTGRITVKYDDSYGGLPTPSYFRHTFAGWYTSRSGGSKIESGSIFRETRNITLYAHWNDIPVTAINGDFSDKTFGVGETRNPGASVSPSSATNTTITWRSNNTNVAKVDGNGNITGISKGTATITASCGGVSRNITVYIKNVVYGYDLSQGSINFGDYMYAPQNDWINGGKPGYQHIHIEFGTKNTVKDGNSVIFYSRRDVGMFGIFIENKKLVVAEVKDGNGHYNLCRTNITLQPNTKYRIEVDPSGTYNIVQNGQLVETGHFPDFRFIVGGSSVTSIPGAYTVMGSVESWYGGAYKGSPAADIYIYKIDSEAGFTHYVRGHGSHPGHAGATHIEVTSNGVINRGGNKDGWVYCDTSVTGINSKAITRILVDY